MARPTHKLSSTGAWVPIDWKAERRAQYTRYVVLALLLGPFIVTAGWRLLDLWIGLFR